MAKVLSDQERALIETHYYAIRDKIKGKIKNAVFRKKPTSIKFTRDSIDEAIGFLPEIICNEFNPDRLGDLNFCEFAAQRCYFRLNDHYRHYYRTQLLKERQKRFAFEQEQILKNTNWSHVNVAKKQIVQEEILQDKKVEPKDKNMTTETIDATVPAKQNLLEDIEWNDLQNNLGQKIDKIFEAQSNRKIGKNKMPTSEVVKILLTDYIIPKSQGLDRKTLKEISERVLIAQSQLCKMIHSDKMKFVVKECLALN